MKVFDFFSGCGGTSSGFSQAGMDIAMGLDIDPDSSESFRANFPKAKFLLGDIRDMDVEILRPIIGKKRKTPLLFCGCAPCQPFSTQNRNQNTKDPRRDLLSEFSRFVAYWLPEYVFIENVPGIQKVKGKSGPFHKFNRLLKDLGYSYASDVIPAMSFGVPQTRKRLVLLARRGGDITLPEASHGPEKKPYTTVRDAIGHLPRLPAGCTDPSDPHHQAAELSELNLRRIAHTPEGGGREAWPEELRLDCHQSHTGHSDVYGRLAWDKMASGLTTRCISYSNGRFGHPEQDRALSVREAALIQTFPINYQLSGNLASRARQVGNAVPPAMALAVGRHLMQLSE
ncbi:DNA (cytosine-5-)-methyltransferase [Duganella radicis]|uniref:DNA (cytosine-5-)-methyltransferase n=1 Tax=Duganella radicis TaxID=551988 RepID=A0A6L6PQS3_9BURK|nr:DNA (cytosine-5-)-methyltransferase [Duganella radicis]